MRLPDECVEARTTRVIVAEENGQRMVLKNPNRKFINKIDVDKCVFKDDSSRKRCDFVFEIAEPMELVYYLELKGSKIAHGIEQLAATLGYFAERHKGVPRRCVLIASSVPALNAGTQATMDRYYREHGVKLDIKRSAYTVTV